MDAHALAGPPPLRAGAGVTRRFYDVAFLGTSLEALLAAALLARRGFRVLVLGQGAPAPTYRAAGRTWPRRAHTFLATHSPVAKRVLAELALHQSFRRRSASIDPAFQVVLPDHRFEFALDAAALEREIARELPTVKRAVEDFGRACTRYAANLDRAFERDLLWPPETFFERREVARAIAHQPFGRDGWGIDPFAEFPDPHPFRTIVAAPVHFSSGMAAEPPVPLSLTRLYWAWCHAAKLDGGFGWLHQALIEKITTYSGELRARESADRLLLKRGAVTGLRLAGSGEEIGCGFVAHARDIDSLLRLLPERGALRELFERLGEPTPRWFRYTLNVLVHADGVPEGIARDVFFVRDPARLTAGGETALRIDVSPVDSNGLRLFTVEALLPRRGVEEIPGYVVSMRKRILSALSELAPFIDSHIHLVDSPHDGVEVHDMQRGAVVAPDEPWTRGPATMEPVHGYPVHGTLGVFAFPTRTPIRRLLLCGPHIAPGLGDEGAFLTAWSTARIVTRSDRRKEWMRRGLWTKIEI